MKKILLLLLIGCIIFSFSCRNRHRGYPRFSTITSNVDFSSIKTFAFEPESKKNDPLALERQIAAQMSSFLGMREVMNDMPDITVRFKYGTFSYGRSNYFDGSYKQGAVIDNFTIEFIEDFEVILIAAYPTAVNALNSRNLIVQMFVDIQSAINAYTP